MIVILAVRSVSKLKNINPLIGLGYNPVIDYLFINNKSEVTEPLSEILIYSYDGHSVYIDSSIDENGVDVSTLIPGLYLIKVRLGEYEMWRKFIKI